MLYEWKVIVGLASHWPCAPEFVGDNSSSDSKVYESGGRWTPHLYMQWRRNEFESGGTDPAQSAGKMFLVVPLHFLAIKAQLVVVMSAFVMASTVWSVYCLLFYYSRCPLAQPFVKVRRWHVPPVPYGVGATAPMLTPPSYLLWKGSVTMTT